RVRAERERSLDGHTLHGDGEVGSRHPDAEDIARLHPARLAERLLHRLPVGICGEREPRRADDDGEAEKNHRVPQPLRFHDDVLPFHLACAWWSRETWSQRMLPPLSLRS